MIKTFKKLPDYEDDCMATEKLMLILIILI